MYGRIDDAGTEAGLPKPQRRKVAQMTIVDVFLTRSMAERARDRIAAQTAPTIAANLRVGVVPGGFWILVLPH